MAKLRKGKVIILALIAVALILRIPILLVRYFDPDEFEHLHAARNIYHGMVPYRDYFEHHTPFLHFLMAPLYLFWGDTIPLLFVARGIMLIFTCAILYLTYRLTKLLYGSDTALYAAVFLSYMIMFLEKTIEIRPDLPGVTFWLLTLIFFIIGIKSKQRLHFLLSGVMIGGAILSTQKALFTGMGLFLALMWFLLDRRTGLSLQERAFAILWIVFGLLIPVVVVCLYFLPHRALDDFIDRNFIMNLHWRSKFWPYGYIKQVFRQNVFFGVFGLLGLIIATLQLRQREEATKGSFVPVISTYMLIVGLFLMPVPYRQYYLLFIPLLAMYCGLVAVKLVKYLSWSQISTSWCKTKSSLVRAIVKRFIPFIYVCGYISLAFGIIVQPLSQMLGQFLIIKLDKPRYIRLNHSNAGRLNEVRFILQNTTPQDTVLDGWTGSGVFRDHAYYYYFLHSEVRNMLTPKESSEDVVNALRRKETKIIIYDGNVQALSQEVRNYVEANYKPTGVGNLYVRKN